MPKKHMSPGRIIKKIVVNCDEDFENTEADQQNEKMPLKSIMPVSDNDETSSDDKESSDFEEQIKPPPKKCMPTFFVF